jgi:cytochrome c oxidase subunit 2
LILRFYFFKMFLLQSVENPASVEAEKINRLFNYFNIAAAGMLLLVGFLIVYICIKFARKKTDNDEPRQTSGNKKLEAIMIGGPTLLLAFFFYQTVTTINAVAPTVDKGRQPDVIITGHQWWWEVQYPSSKVITANEIHLPVGKPLLMEMRAADVIHDWWVPELGNKIDVVPGKINYLTLNIKRAGHYIGACSEFCGAQHAWMRIHVIAQSPADFQKWILENEKSAVQPDDTLAMEGSQLFQQKTCATCHRIQGTPAAGIEGPDLTHLASRKQLLTGLMDNNETDLMKWVGNPQEVKPGAHMPDFKFQKDSLRAIVHYLAQLK